MRANKKTVSRKQSYKSKKEKTKHKKNAHTKTYKNKLNYRKTKKNKTYNSKYNKKGGAAPDTIDVVNAVDYKLKNFIFLDNEETNFYGINDDKVTCIKVADKGDKKIPTKQYDENFDKYWTNTGDNNQIVKNVPDVSKLTTFAYFDTHNSLTTDELNTLYTKLKSGGKRICLWDWDRTISMEEGFQAHPTINFTYSKGNPITTFTTNEVINNYNEVKNLSVILDDYMNQMHINNQRIWEATYKLKAAIKPKQYTNYLLGGEARVTIFSLIFSLENVKHCVISNNPAFNLFNDFNHKILFIRAIFNEMGLTSKLNNNILLLHCGLQAKASGGYTKPEFVNNLISDKHDILVPEIINTLKELSDYRIHQLKCFLENKPPNPVKKIDYEEIKTSQLPLPRSRSEPASSLTRDSEPVSRDTSLDNIDVRS